MTHQTTRRGFLITGGSLLALTRPEPGLSMFLAQPASQSNLFASGIASGDPLPGAVVIWTRLMPEQGASWAKARVPVTWEVASDEKMQKLVKKGSTFATPELGHAVHIDVTGLQPERWYFYRFHAGKQTSPVGRTKTAPAPQAANAKFNFAFASCQHFETGYYTAYKHMAQQDLDLIIHLGDYIYEGKGVAGRTRQHTGDEITTLSDYRNRYALYRTDANLREAHRLLLDGARGAGKQPRELRRSQNWIGGTWPGNAVFVPPPPEDVAELLANLERFIHEPASDFPPLVKVAPIDAQFETIHPFLDGNGCIGRLLIAALFEHWGLLSEPLILKTAVSRSH